MILIRNKIDIFIIKMMFKHLVQIVTIQKDLSPERLPKFELQIESNMFT